MGRLSNNIDTLLALHDCVIIPSFGAIIKEQQPPFYDREVGVLYPGKTTLHFNKELRESDGLLEDVYAQSYGLSKRRARLLLEQDVEELMTVLHRTGRVSLSSIGNFLLVENGALDFFPETPKTLFSSGYSYGLIPYHLPALQKVASSASFFSHKNEKETVKSDYIYFRLHKKATAWIAAAVVLIVCLLPVTYQPVGNYFSAGIMPLSQSSLVERERVSKQIVSEKVVEIKENSSVKSEQVTLQKNLEEGAGDSCVLPKNSKEGYYVVIGAFRTEAKVLSFMESCQEASFANTMGYLQKGSRKVIYAVCKETAQEAQEFIRSLAETDPAYKEAWVLHYSE